MTGPPQASCSWALQEIVFEKPWFAPEGAQPGSPIPVTITVYQDHSFDFVTKLPPVSYMIKKAANLKSGSKAPGRDKAGKITKAQIKEIATKKMPDMNCHTVEAAMEMVAGQARSMGIEVVE